MLKLGNNRLAALPGGLFGLEQLLELHLARNALTSLDGPWAQLKELQLLDLAHNELQVVPAEVGWLPLQALQLEGNVNLRIPASVQAQGFRQGGRPPTP